MTGSDTYGLLEEAGGRWRLRFTRTLRYPPEVVWRALTEPDDLAAWFPTTVEGERAAGAPLRFSFPKGEAEPFDGEMLVYDPPSVLEFRWGPDTLRFEVRPVPGGSRLTLLDTFEEQGKAARDAAGWHVCLDALDAHLADPATTPEPSAWKPLNDAYTERFGPEASSVGPPG
jgi:uncharacterized protein YndB with AHSA1/START domain